MAISLSSTKTNMNNSFCLCVWKANRAKLLWPFREVQLYRILVREVGELLRSIDSPSISNPNENRSE
ncbi:hypothetical protein Hdeb2414_s0007g00237961 [Helianthus debilis subsp. tardiflorus]